MESNNGLEMINNILMVYAIPFGIILLAGIVVIIIGFSKQKRGLKLAGLIIAVTGLKLLIVLGFMSLYMKFITTMTQI